MTRPISAGARAALFAPETAEAFIILLTISHADMETPIRVTSDSLDTLSRGNTFTAFPFTITLPDDEDSKSPHARLAIDNIDRRIVLAVRALPSSPTVLIEVVRQGDSDVVEAVFRDFRFSDIRYDSRVVEGVLTIEDFTAEPYPAATFCPSLFPAIF